MPDFSGPVGRCVNATALAAVPVYIPALSRTGDARVSGRRSGRPLGIVDDG